MILLKISAKGWVVIPAELRRKYGLEPGTQVQVIDYGGALAHVPLLKGHSSLTQALLDEHAQEIARES